MFTFFLTSSMVTVDKVLMGLIGQGKNEKPPVESSFIDFSIHNSLGNKRRGIYGCGN